MSIKISSNRKIPLKESKLLISQASELIRAFSETPFVIMNGVTLSKGKSDTKFFELEKRSLAFVWIRCCSIGKGFIETEPKYD